MHSDSHIGAVLSSAHRGGDARVFWVVAACLAWPILVYWPTAWSMVQIWHRSETFAHGFVVVPLFLWLIWDRRFELARVPQRLTWSALPALLLAVALWLFSQLASALAPAQFAVVSMVPLLVLFFLGPRVAGFLAFPLVFLFFAVPFGEFLVPKMMDWTADFTVAAVRASGVPVYREGNQFVIPSGRWSVIEACSGLRYLIASTMVGVLFAFLTFRSAFRRVAFVIASIVVPIFANWLRAYIIVMLGHLSDNALASGIDHVIYGWVFFGVVMVLLFWVGSFWREERADTAAAPSGRLAPEAVSARVAAQGRVAAERLSAAALVAAAAVTLLGPALQWFVTHDQAASSIEVARLAPAAGWVEEPDALPEWHPDLVNPSVERRQVFTKDGRAVGVYVAGYVDQRQGAELVNQMNQIARTRNSSWSQVDRGGTSMSIAGRDAPVRTAVLKGTHGQIEVRQWYSIGGDAIDSDLVAKVMLALSKLRGRGDASAWVAVYADADGVGGNDADPTLRQFVADMGDQLKEPVRPVLRK